MLVENICVMQAGAAPGGEGHSLSRQGIFTGQRPITERLQGLTQLLLQGSAAITSQDQRQQVDRLGLALGTQFQRDVKGHRHASHLIELPLVWGFIEGKESR